MRCILWVILCTAILSIFSPSTSRAQQPPPRIAFASCADSESPPTDLEPIIPEARAVLFIGDAIYATHRLPSSRRSGPSCREAGYEKLSNLSLWAVWDDHDYGPTTGGGISRRRNRSSSSRLFSTSQGFAAPPQAWHLRRQGVRPPRRACKSSCSIRVTSAALSRSATTGAGTGLCRQRRSELDHARRRPVQWLEATAQGPGQDSLLVSTIQLVAEDHHWKSG